MGEFFHGVLPWSPDSPVGLVGDFYRIDHFLQYLSVRPWSFTANTVAKKCGILSSQNNGFVAT